MKKPTFIYFDVGGVLLDYRSGHLKVAKKYNTHPDVLFAVFEKNWKDACRGTLPNDVYMGYFC